MQKNPPAYFGQTAGFSYTQDKKTAYHHEISPYLYFIVLQPNFITLPTKSQAFLFMFTENFQLFL